jgi:hypothetical protein
LGTENAAASVLLKTVNLRGTFVLDAPSFRSALAGKTAIVKTALQRPAQLSNCPVGFEDFA